MQQWGLGTWLELCLSLLVKIKWVVTRVGALSTRGGVLSLTSVLGGSIISQPSHSSSPRFSETPSSESEWGGIPNLAYTRDRWESVISVLGGRGIRRSRSISDMR